MQAVPFIDLGPVTELVASLAEARWQRTLRTHAFLGGPDVAELEGCLGATLGVQHAVAVSSGTMALMIALRAVGVGPRSVVAMPALTFWATYEAVVQTGATPVLIDCHAADGQLRVAEVVSAHETYRFTHVVTAHLFGWASRDLLALRTWCRERAIPLVEDAAQAAGVVLNNEPLLADADVATLSFFPAKVIGGCADGGAVVSRHANVANEARLLAHHGRSAHFAHERAGYNGRMGALAAGYLCEVFARASQLVAARTALLFRYHEQLAHLAGCTFMMPPPGVHGNGYLAVLLVDAPVALANALREQGIATGRVYPATVADQVAAKGCQAASALPNARAFCQRVINLPLYYGLDVAAQDRVIKALKAALS